MPGPIRRSTGRTALAATWIISLITGLGMRKAMVERKAPPMICVMLDESLPEGTHEFADSVNNGPWGAALTREFIPWLDRSTAWTRAATGAF